jgi:short-subunit dehydrogenase
VPQTKIREGTKHRLQQKLRQRVCAGLSLCAGTAHSGAKQRTKQQDTHARSNLNQVAALEGTHAAKPRELCLARKKSEPEEQNRHVERRNTKNFKSGTD